MGRDKFFEKIMLNINGIYTGMLNTQKYNILDTSTMTMGFGS